MNAEQSSQKLSEGTVRSCLRLNSANAPVITSILLSFSAIFAHLWLGIPAIIVGHLAWARARRDGRLKEAKRCLLPAMITAYAMVCSGFITGRGTEGKPEQTVSLSRSERQDAERLEPLQIEAAPVVDEEVFLMALLEHFYTRIPNELSPTHDQQLSALDSRVQLVTSKLEGGRVGPDIHQAYNDLLTVLHRRRQSVVAKSEIQVAASKAETNAIIETGIVSIGGGYVLGKAMDDFSDNEGSGLALLTAAAGVIKTGWDAFKGAKQRNEAKQELIRHHEVEFEAALSRGKESARAAALTVAHRKNLPRSATGFVDSPEQEERRQRLIEAKDWTALHQVISDDAKAKPLNPFIAIYRIILEVEIGLEERTADECLSLARNCIELARLVPDGPPYAEYRREFVDYAGELALVAARKQVGARGLAAAPVDAGRMAVVFWKTALSIVPNDPTGYARQSLGEAFSLAGDVPTAAITLDEVNNLRVASPDYHYLMARCRSHLYQPEIAFEHLKAALASGYTNVTKARNDPDLVNLLKSLKQRTDDLLTVKYSWKLNYGIFWDDIILTNESAFPLTNVVLLAEVSNQDGLFKPSQQLTIDRLAPGGSQTWKSCISVKRGRTERDVTRGNLQCDQGKL